MGADGKRGMEEAELCCPTRLQRPLDRDQDSETVEDRNWLGQSKYQIEKRKKELLQSLQNYRKWRGNKKYFKEEMHTTVKAHV